MIPTLSLQSIPEIYISGAWVNDRENPMNPKIGMPVMTVRVASIIVLFDIHHSSMGIRTIFKNNFWP